MSLLFLSHLSGREGNFQQSSNHDPPPEIGTTRSSPAPNLVGPAPTPDERPMSQTPPNMDPTLERDEYGAEMGKEARVWKIYVKETDRADAELVDGWNKSLDVILVFAALFSAISTTFLIESSQKLQEDPADVTAQLLLAISQALSVLANTTQPVTMNPLSSINAGSFSPPQVMVAVNALWYLSLSLSVATSFLAMLAKDWCHSFMSARTGHPHTQTIRRQQKWMMVEKWKLQELIMVLPLLIHISLLLFAVGLCIYAWELNTKVAWPVICVTGASAGFYVWSSITASITQYFPYTTVISRFLRSEWLSEFRWKLLHRSYKLTLIVAARMISNALERIYDSDILGRFRSLDDCINAWCNSLRDWADGTRLTLPMAPEAPSRDICPHPSKFTTYALHWLVTTCETPGAIDAALQAIAGANPSIYREPLETCNAGREISKRLVSGNIYRSTDRHVVSLYVRALSFLGSDNNSNPPGQTNTHSSGELQVSIWSLQTQYDDQVARMTGDGTFEPSDHNIQALGIGSSIASFVLQHLNGLGRHDTSPVGSICRLLRSHCSGTETLHPAALRSLMNASELLSICIMDLGDLVQLLDRLLWLAVADELPQVRFAPISHAPTKQMALRCVSLLRRNFSRLYADITRNISSSPFAFATEMIHHVTASNFEFTDLTSPNFKSLIAADILAVMTHTNLSSVLTSRYGPQEAANQDKHLRIKGFLVLISNCRIWPTALFERFDEVLEVYRRTNDPTEFSSTYLVLAEAYLCIDSSSMMRKCIRSFANSPFPRLTTEFVGILEKHNIIPHLEQASNNASDENVRIFSISLLWLLCALESCTSTLPYREAIPVEFGTKLHRCTTWGDSTVMKRALGYQLYHHWLTWNDSQSWHQTDSDRRHLSRVLECVVEAGDHITPSTEVAVGEEFTELKAQLEAYNKHLPEDCRGLASFTGYQPSTSVRDNDSYSAFVATYCFPSSRDITTNMSETT